VKEKNWNMPKTILGRDASFSHTQTIVKFINALTNYYWGELGRMKIKGLFFLECIPFFLHSSFSSPNKTPTDEAKSSFLVSYTLSLLISCLILVFVGNNSKGYITHWTPSTLSLHLSSQGGM